MGRPNKGEATSYSNELMMQLKLSLHLVWAQTRLNLGLWLVRIVVLVGLTFACSTKIQEWLT